jgi:hypothetical protein
MPANDLRGRVFNAVFRSKLLLKSYRLSNQHTMLTAVSLKPFSTQLLTTNLRKDKSLILSTKFLHLSWLYTRNYKYSGVLLLNLQEGLSCALLNACLPKYSSTRKWLCLEVRGQYNYIKSELF